MIPGIFSGLVFLVILIVYRVMIYEQQRGSEHPQAMIWLAVGTIFVTFVCGYLILTIILKPIARFVRNAEKASRDYRTDCGRRSEEKRF